jgi:hypothetical protein
VILGLLQALLRRSLYGETECGRAGNSHVKDAGIGILELLVHGVNNRSAWMQAVALIRGGNMTVKFWLDDRQDTT